MKTYSLLFSLFISFNSFAQIDYKKQLDSLTIVHKVCTIESNIRNHRSKMDQLRKQRQNLNNQLAEIQGFKLRRTEVEKEEQLTSINKHIEANAVAITTATVYLTNLINDLVLANEDVKDLQND